MAHGAQRSPYQAVPPKGGVCSAVLGKVETHLAVALGVVAPALAHLDEQKEMHRHSCDLRNLLSRRRSDFLDGLTLGAEHDLALALTCHIDGLLDPDALVLQLLPLGRF